MLKMDGFCMFSVMAITNRMLTMLRRHEDGSWERDATVEFDSDDENANNAPTLEQ